MTSQNAHLRLASQQSFLSVRVPFSTICPFGGLSCWVQSLAVKVQVSSTPTVSCHAFTLFAFEPVTSTNQINSAKTASKASAKMQVPANSNKMPSIFQLIVESKQTYRRKSQQDLVDSSSLKTIIANFPLSKSSLQSAPNSSLKRNDKFIVVSKLRAPDESVSNKNFQLVVDSKLILNSEGACAVTITSYSVYEGAQQHSSGNATETNGINFGESASHRVDEKNEFRVNYVGNNPFQQTNLPLIVDNSSKSQLIVKSIWIPSYEGA
jgi:hypothetical protein